MVDMARKEIIPAVEKYVSDIATAYSAKKNSVAGISVKYDEDMLKKLSVLVDEMDAATKELEIALVKYNTIKDITEASEAIRDDVIPKMSVLRIACDEAETITAESYWPFPTYGDLLFGVK